MCPPTSDTAPNQALLHPGLQPVDFPECVPLDPISQSAFKYALEHLHPAILNHSLRVYLYTLAISHREAQDLDSEGRLALLFAACILHDIGTTNAHDGSQRFEVEGADAAAELLRAKGVTESAVHDVWIAIALHTSPGIAERISPLARLVRLGVTIDFKRPAAMGFTSAAEMWGFEAEFPRMGIEKVLGDAVVAQARWNPEKAPAASWAGVLLRSALENPGWEGVNKAF